MIESRAMGLEHGDLARTECHAVCFDSNGELVGLTLPQPKRLLEREGALPITVPS